MTISIAWVRTVGTCEELVFASDSRLSGTGYFTDYCPKLSILPRSDCAIGFAGYTHTSYPLMSQLSLAINAHKPLLNRSMEIRQLLSHALKIFDSMASSITVDIPWPTKEQKEAATDPGVTFIFGGYSWVRKCFEIWDISFDYKENKFVAKPATYVVAHPKARKVFFQHDGIAFKNSNAVFGKIAFGGDQGPEAEKRFIQLMNNRLDWDNEDSLYTVKLDMEPFEVLRDMLKDPNKPHSIGGAPQVIKVYQHMNAAPIAVYWPNKSSGQAWLLGRPILGYENIDYWMLDPDVLRTTHPKHTKVVEKPESEADTVLSEGFI